MESTIGSSRRITTAAVEARVRRALVREGQVLCKPRGEAERRELGDYFTVDAVYGNRERWHLELEELAREYRVLRPGEVIED